MSLVAGDPEVRMFFGGLVALLRKAYGEGAVAATEEEGARTGRELGRSLRNSSIEQTAEQVLDVLERLSFASGPPIGHTEGLYVDLRHGAFSVDPNDPDGVLVCAFHEGLVRGVAEVSSGEDVAVRLLLKIRPGVCRVEFLPRKPGSPGRGAAPTRL